MWLDKIKKNAPTKSIWVTFQREGTHCYPEALTDPNLSTGDWDDVSFLANPHRHVFHFRVRIEVFHNDRDIEFIQFKRWCQRQFDGPYDVNGPIDIDYKSVEMLADDLYKKINEKYPGRFVEIEVSEDGENGCQIFYPRKD